MKHGWGVRWNDGSKTTEEMVRAQAIKGVHITDEDLEEMFGPQWLEVVRVIRVSVGLMYETRRRIDKALNEVSAERWRDVWVAARKAAGLADRKKCIEASMFGMWPGTTDALTALVVKDLISTEDFEILVGPWVQVMGRTWEA